MLSNDKRQKRTMMNPLMLLLPILLSNTNIPLHYTPKSSQIHIQSLTLRYKPSLLRTLFSSVPQRTYALQDVTFRIPDTTNAYFSNLSKSDHNNDNKCIRNKHEGLVLLLGVSSSGKSALMKCLCAADTRGKIESLSELNGAAICMEGSITINNPDKESSRGIVSANPVLLDRKFRGYNDDSKSVKEWILFDVCSSSSTILAMDRMEHALHDFALVVELSISELNGKPSALSPSSQFLATLICGSLKSILMQLRSNNENYTSLFYPILCLDELFDAEHSSVTQKVGRGLQRLTELGGVVLVATHKPTPLHEKVNRIITLSGGKLLRDESRKSR